MDKIIELLKKMKAEKFWGELKIRFKNGEIVLINKDEQIKID